MIRLGLIGCGEHAQTGHAAPLARYCAEHPGEIVLAAACDVRRERAEKFCQEFGFQAAYSDFNEMCLREVLDGCITVVPPERISELGCALLEKRMPCVVEKPLGISIAEVHKIREVAAATQTANMVSVNRRFMPFLNRALDWVHNAGTARYVRCTMARHARSEQKFIWETAVHAVDTLRYIAGEVRAFDVTRLDGAAKDAAWYLIDLHFANGVEGGLDVLPTAGIAEETYVIFGEGFRASVTCPFGPLRGWKAFQNGVLVEAESASPEMPEDAVNGCYDEAAEFINALKTGTPPGPSVAEVAASVELCMSIAART